MITIEDAIKKVKKNLSEDLVVLKNDITEKEYGWVIYIQTKKYLETGYPFDALTGEGGTFVEKSTGKMVEFGSTYTTEDILQIYELGYLQYDNLDILITYVRNKSKTIEFLVPLGISYVIPEAAYGVIWKIPSGYSREQLEEKLNCLPVRFNLGKAYYKWKVLESFKEQNDFEYQLLENKGYKNFIHYKFSPIYSNICR